MIELMGECGRHLPHGTEAGRYRKFPMMQVKLILVALQFGDVACDTKKRCDTALFVPQRSSMRLKPTLAAFQRNYLKLKFDVVPCEDLSRHFLVFVPVLGTDEPINRRPHDVFGFVCIDEMQTRRVHLQDHPVLRLNLHTFRLRRYDLTKALLLVREPAFRPRAVGEFGAEALIGVSQRQPQ